MYLRSTTLVCVVTPALYILGAQQTDVYESWIVANTGGHVSMEWRLVAGRYLLHVDTLADSLPSARRTWIRVQEVHVPAPPTGYRIATECSYHDSLATGRVVAIVRATQTERYTDVRRAWRLDRNAFRILATDTKGLTCANPGWGTP